MSKKISYERRVYESVDDNSLSKAISQKPTKKNKSCDKGLIKRRDNLNTLGENDINVHLLVNNGQVYLEDYCPLHYFYFKTVLHDEHQSYTERC